MLNARTRSEVTIAYANLDSNLTAKTALVLIVTAFLQSVCLILSFEDIDECSEDGVQCPGGNTSMCVNIPGSYDCRCKVGYNGNPLSVLGCIDINECLIPEFYCGPNAECENTPGNFRCHCHSGYQRNADATDCEGTYRTLQNLDQIQFEITYCSLFQTLTNAKRPLAVAPQCAAIFRDHLVARAKMDIRVMV